MNHTPRRSAPRFRILIVDDDAGFTEDMAAFLGDRYDIGVAHDEKTAGEQIGALQPDVVLLDIDLGGRGDQGFAILEFLRGLESAPEAIMLTGSTGTDIVVSAIKAGAFHYVTKPPVMSELVNLVNRAAARVCDARRLAAMESQVQRLGGELVVRDRRMQKVMKDLERVGPTETTVMITGESGTGKELVARHLHELSRRADGPFVAVNCGAISEQLIESELFGHVRGAFTGAERDREGCFAKARGGTIFLDEIGYAPVDLQVKLLRVLESREYQRVGSNGTERADVRVVAASSRDLREGVDAGTFREELYFRLNVFRVVLPPLRERPDDILPLAEHFLGLYGAQIGRRDLAFSDAAVDFLRRHPWRGNVRELRNLIERTVIMSDGGPVGVRLLAEDDRELPAVLPPLRQAEAAVVERFRRAYVARVLQEADGNVTEAARRAGVARETLSRMVGELGLREG